MYFGIKDILLYSGLALVVALTVNHYGKLNVEFLDWIEESIVSATLTETEIDYSNEMTYSEPEYSTFDRKCQTTLKMAGDARITIRSGMEKAERENNMDQRAALEEKLEKINEKVRADCG